MHAVLQLSKIVGFLIMLLANTSSSEYFSEYQKWKEYYQLWETNQTNLKLETEV